MRLHDKDRKDGNKKNESKVKKNIKKQMTAVVVTIAVKLIPLLLVATIVSSLVEFVVKIFNSKNTVDTIYESLEIEDVYDLISIEGNDTDGYYLDFADDIDDKLDDTIEYLDSTAGVKSGVGKEFLKKLIKAEIYTQFPDLGGNIGTSSGFQGAVNIVRITPNKEINALTNTGAGQETVISQDENSDIEITNKEEIAKQETIIKSWGEGKELKIGATAFVYDQQESKLHPGEKIDYWVPQKSEKTQQNLKLSGNQTVTYTGNYSVSVNKLTSEGLIYVEIEKDDIKGYVKYSYILNEANGGSLDDVDDEEFVDSGYVEQTNQKIVDTIDSNVYKLAYIPKEKFDEYIANADKSVLNYFTLDDDGNLITATWAVKEDGTVEFKNSSTINLKSALKNLVMPYAYLMYFYIDADYKDFSSDLADEVLNSKIIIAIEDNITTSYTKETVEEKKVSESSQFSYDWQVKSVTESTTESCYTKVDVIYADTWCVKMVNKEIYKEELLNLEVGKTQNLNMPGKVTETNSDSISEETLSEEGNDTEEVIVSYRDTDGKMKTKREDKEIPYSKYERTVTNNHSISNSYSSSSDEKEPESKENVFINLFKKHKMYNQINDERLLKILENDSRTANLVNLTKYLMFMSTGISYDNVTEFDFSEFDLSNFNKVSSGGGILTYYLKAWENGTVTAYLNDEISYGSYVSKYITEDKTKYVCYTDVNGTRNFGYGVCHWTGKYWNNVESYSSVGINIQDEMYNQLGVSTLDVSIVDKVMQLEINNFRNYVETKISEAGIQLEDNQIHALTAIAYQYGNIGNFTTVYAQYGNTEQLRENLVVNGWQPFVTGYKGSSYELKRASANWRTFHEGVYTDQSGSVIDPSQFVGDFENLGNGSFLEIAKQCHDYLREYQYWYPSSANIRAGGYVSDGDPVKHRIPTIGEAESERYVDCSAYVSWVLTLYGYEGLWSSGDLLSNPFGFEVVPVSQAQPGDILVRSGHTEIYMGDGKSYNCGWTGAIRAEYSDCNPNSFSIALRVPTK